MFTASDINSIRIDRLTVQEKNFTSDTHYEIKITMSLNFPTGVDVSKTAIITKGTNKLEGVASGSSYVIAEDGNSAVIIYRFTAQNSRTYEGRMDTQNKPEYIDPRLQDEFDIFFGVLVSNE